VANGLLSVYDWPRLSVGRELCPVLLSETLQRRSRAVRQWMKTHLGNISSGPVLCTNIDLLFEPTLKLDPLRLMRDVSRVTRLVVTWPGSSHSMAKAPNEFAACYSKHVKTC